MSPSAGVIVIAGAIAQRPGISGHAWVFLNHLLGLRKLGFEVLFVDQLKGNAVQAEVAWLRRVMARAGLAESWSLLLDVGTVGLSRKEVIERTRSSLFLLNVNGFLHDEEILEAAPKRVFLDIDPGFAQMWRELKLADVFAGHDRFVTIAGNIGRPGCGIPTCGLDWITTRQPVVLEEWPDQRQEGTCFTSVGRWRSTFAPVEYAGRTYGLRVHEFRKFVSLPQLVNEPFELALEIDLGDARDLQMLQANGWRLADPSVVAGDVDAYRVYLQKSKAEFLVAKNIYVDTLSGWFSDRSVCYLASGRPVVAQDTGLGETYPVGEGLLIYRTLPDAIAAIGEIHGDYHRHSRRAREIAEEFFDSDMVLARLVETVTR